MRRDRPTMLSSRPVRLVLTAVAAAVLSACASSNKPKRPEAPTIATLLQKGGQPAVKPDAGPALPGQTVTEETASRAYRDFLASAPRDPQRQEALRRLGDLEMDRVDAQVAAGERQGTPEDYKAAIAQYNDFLKQYPNAAGNDRVLYQLARAHELSGDLDTALKTLTQLVEVHPNTRFLEEAQFRRGELLFTLRDYGKAEEAYKKTLMAGPGFPYYERSMYMHGWSQFKQGRLEESLHSFFGVLDLKLAGTGVQDLEKLRGFTRADRELVEDTFRVTSIALANLQGAASIPPYVTSAVRREYEFRVYQQLGELYIKQERVKDAADTFSGYAQKNPQHPESPVMQARVIDIYANGGFETLALDAKKQYVSFYGVGSEYQRNNRDTWTRSAEPLVKSHLADLAQHYHATAQKSKKAEDYSEAVRWYREYLTSFPKDEKAAQNNFLLAELLYESARFPEAATEYEKAAYQYPKFDKSADAGYAALLAYGQLEKRLSAGEQRAVQAQSVDSALRFAQAFPEDTRRAPVLTNAAEKLFTLNDPRAPDVAKQVLALQPAADASQRRVAWTVLAHSAFDQGRFAEAEKSYGEVLALVPEKDAARASLTERLAASVYKQGEAAKAGGNLRDAVGHFTRVASVAPTAAARATAQYDAAAVLLELKDWDAAARTLEDFRRNYPKHPLQDDVTSKLAVAYVEKGSWGQAAAEFEKLASVNKDPALARAGLWQAAEMYEKAGVRAQAARTYERYIKQYPNPLEPALEARYRLARVAKEDGNGTRELALMREVQRADATAGAERTNRTRYLGGMATLALARPLVEEYRKVPLVEPLARNLKLKKARFETALKAFAAASDYGVAEVVTAATFQSAELYRDFGKAMMNSQRPRGLKKDELEQYNVLLEEQAFPFEEKAIELHEVNARRTTGGLYDDSVKASIAALGQMRPARYGKVERAPGVVDAIR